GAVRNVSNDNTYTGALTLATDSTIGVNTGSTLIIGTKSNLAGTGTITDAGGNRQLTKELTGTLVLASANTYGGKTLVNAGVLNIQNGNALGGIANGTEVLDGAQLQLETPSTGPLAGQSVLVKNEHLTLSGTGIFGTGVLLNTTGDNTWQGPVTLNAAPGFAPATQPAPYVAFGVANFHDTLTIDGPIDETPAS